MLDHPGRGLIKLPACVQLGMLNRTLAAPIGVRACRRVSDAFFFRLIYTLLAVTGAKLVWDALT